MHIVHIIWSLGTGGAETMLIDIINSQVKTESVALAVVNDIVEENLLNKIDSCCLVCLLRRKIGSRSLIPWIRLNLFLFKFRPDIIHFHLEGMRKMVLHPAPKVFTIHNVHTSGNEYRKFHALFAISDGVKEYTKKQGYETVTVWNGIDTKTIRQKSAIVYRPGDVCKIVCVGRLFTPHKGQDILVQALDLLREKGCLNFHLDLIGDGESREQLQELVEKEGLREYISFLGQKDRSYIYSHLCDYDLFVLPSRSEGFGLSVAEALCAKVPVVVCDLEGAMDVIDGGRLGMSFKTGDENSLAEQICTFIKYGEEESVINDACQFAIDHFDIRQTAQRYIEEYNKVLRH